VFYAEWWGAVADGSTDDSSALQAAIDAVGNAAGTLVLKAQSYRVNTALTVTKKCTIQGQIGRTFLVLGTQNMNGMVIGDGTSDTRDALFNTVIQGLSFVPLVGVTAFASGACIERNYVSYVDLIDCTFYGHDGTSTKLWNGVNDVRADTCNTTRCRFTFFQNNGFQRAGTGSGADRTINGHHDYLYFSEISGDAIYYGDHCEGESINFANAFDVDGYCVHVNSASGLNFFINQPDFELGGGGGIHAEVGSVVQVTGGWLGGPNAFVSASTSANHLIAGVQFDSATLDIDSPATTITGCNINGDNSTTVDGVIVRANADDFNMAGCRVQQYTQHGINLVDKPARMSIVGVSFATIGGNEINVASAYALADQPPTVSGCNSDRSAFITAASAIPHYPGVEFIQISGATAVDSIGWAGRGTILTIQSNQTGGSTINNGSPILLNNGANLTIPQFFTATFTTDGSGTWFEVGRSF
jgi:hypothetical protein